MQLLSLVTIYEPEPLEDDVASVSVKAGFVDMDPKQLRVAQLRKQVDELIAAIKDISQPQEGEAEAAADSENAGMPDGVSALNFRSHAAALKLQQTFRMRKEAR